MEEHGFKLVRSRRRYSRLKKSGLSLTDRIEGALDDIEAAVAKADSQIEESGFSTWIIKNIQSLLGNRRVLRLYLIGNGHFDAPWEPGAHQIALMRRICLALEAEMVFQEPCVSSAERDWLKNQKGVVLRECSSVRFDVTDGDCSIIGIVAILHGLHDLLNDFLTYNWRSNLCNILLLCNDYRDIDFVGENVRKNCEFPALDIFRKHAKFVSFPEYSPNPLFFLNSSIAYLEKGILLPELSAQ